MFLSNLVTVLKVAKKKLTLDAATEAFQFFSDCNETESVIKEFITLAKSKVRRIFVDRKDFYFMFDDIFRISAKTS